FRNVDPSYQKPPARELTMSPGELRRYDVTVERLGIVNLTVLEAQDAGAVAQADNVTVRATLTTGTGEFVASTVNGFVSFARLVPGTWRLAVVDPADPTGETELVATHVDIDLNQEIAAQLVMTSGLPTFTFHV